MKDNISPEEKLLKLIRGQQKPTSSVSEKINPPLDKSSKVTLEILPQVNYEKKYFSFFPLQKIALYFFIAALIYLAVSFLYPLWEEKNIPTQLKIQPPLAAGEFKAAAKKEPKPLESYLAPIRGRQIFSAVRGEAPGTAAKAADASLIKDINLVGIISGDNPQAIIEDKKSQKNYYLSKGQFIGDLKVEDIEEGKIILNYNGQKYELHL
jgi:hypothetical protein